MEPSPVLSFLDQLNPQQRAAVETTDGPVLILAGAGSGKTRVITYRIAYLIENLGVDAGIHSGHDVHQQGRAEMVERVDKLVGGLSIAKPLSPRFTLSVCGCCGGTLNSCAFLRPCRPGADRADQELCHLRRI